MNLNTCLYQDQEARWPQTGRHILAQFDAEKVMVYQAFRPKIGQYAAHNGRSFGDNFSLSRMSWIKPNFLWMMYRSGWATKENQETILAVSLKRTAFDFILEQAVASMFDPEQHGSRAEWQDALAASEVRGQWDPDHAPDGATKFERRASQAELRGDILAQYASDWIVNIEDITPFVTEQHKHVQSGNLSLLQTPCEDVYPVSDGQAKQLGMVQARTI